MAVNANWKMTVYVANVDVSSTEYETIATSSLSSLSGYATTEISILQVGENQSFDFFVVEDIGGGVASTPKRRTIFDVECYPFKYNDDATEPDLTNYFAFADLIHNKRYMWVKFAGGSRTVPATSGHAMPVVLESWQGQINKEYGTRGLTLNFKHRFNY